eukprot:1053979-Lingulodinium_polyedra.AAC.1
MDGLSPASSTPNPRPTTPWTHPRIGPWPSGRIFPAGSAPAVSPPPALWGASPPRPGGGRGDRALDLRGLRPLGH